MLDLESAIKHCEEVTEAEERSAKLHQRPDKGIKGSGKRYLSCLECASENRQLAEWLRELQKWRALRDSINMLCVVDCEYPMYRESKTMCDACPIGTVKEYFEEIFGEEVNADEEGSESE